MYLLTFSSLLLIILKKLTLILFLLITKHYHKLVNDLPVAVGADVLVYDCFFYQINYDAPNWISHYIR